MRKIMIVHSVETPSSRIVFGEEIDTLLGEALPVCMVFDKDSVVMLYPPDDSPCRVDGFVCRNCHNKFDYMWEACPYCGSVVDEV